MNVLPLLLDVEEREALASRIQGVVVGVVTNNQDPDGMGRVKVKFPWLSDADESNWARVAAPMAAIRFVSAGRRSSSIADQVRVARLIRSLCRSKVTTLRAGVRASGSRVRRGCRRDSRGTSGGCGWPGKARRCRAC